jgi:hypothetical protein
MTLATFAPRVGAIDLAHAALLLRGPEDAIRRGFARSDARRR